MADSKNLLLDIQKFMDDSKSVLASGNNIDLAGLDNQIKNLCAMVDSLSSSEREKYEQPLNELLSQLTILGNDLTVQKEALEHEMRYLSSHKKANVAYKTADAKAPLPEDE